MIDPNVFALAVIAVVGLIVVVAIFFGAWVRVKLPGGTVETMPNRRRKPSREQDTTFDGSAAMKVSASQRAVARSLTPTRPSCTTS